MYITGCAGAPTHYRVILDPTLSAGESGAMASAVADWSVQVTRLRVSVVVAPCTVDLQDGDVCVLSSAGKAPMTADACAVTATHDGMAIVTFYPDSCDATAQVATHELGHAMGLVHAKGPSGTSVMCATQACAATGVMPDDVAAWEYAHP